MQINISARHGHLSAATQERIKEKVEKMRRLFDRITAIQVTVDLQHSDTPDVEIRVVAEEVGECVATEKDEMMTALDRVIHKVEQQLRKHKEKLKLTGHRAAGHKHQEVVQPETEES